MKYQESKLKILIECLHLRYYILRLILKDEHVEPDVKNRISWYFNPN
jgi:hypothetical protein